MFREFSGGPVVRTPHSLSLKSLSCVRLFRTPWTIAYQAPPSMGFSRQKDWSGVPLPSPNIALGIHKTLLKVLTYINPRKKGVILG